MIWKFDYINLYISARKSLHSGNVEKLPVDQIDHIGSIYNKDFFKHYKKQVFLSWFSENAENTPKFLKRTNKLVKKLDIVLTEKENERINAIEPREFTERRAMKTIEVPYKDAENGTLLESNAFFFYKGIRTYEKDLTIYKESYKGEIYMTSKELVLYDRKNNLIQRVIRYDDIDEIILKNHAVICRMNKGKDLYFRYKDNEMIYISLNRSLPTKKQVKFQDKSREEGDTAERTIESFLNLDFDKDTH